MQLEICFTMVTVSEGTQPLWFWNCTLMQSAPQVLCSQSLFIMPVSPTKNLDTSQLNNHHNDQKSSFRNFSVFFLHVPNFVLCKLFSACFPVANRRCMDSIKSRVYFCTVTPSLFSALINWESRHDSSAKKLNVRSYSLCSIVRPYIQVFHEMKNAVSWDIMACGSCKNLAPPSSGWKESVN
jgi:hypothetical protein